MSRIQRALDSAKRRATDTPVDTANQPVVDTSVSSTKLRQLFREVEAAPLDAEVLEKNRLLPAVADHSVTTAYKMLRTRVLQRMRSNQWQTLTVTSAGPNEGKTLTSCNLALSIASDVNQSVILVGLDLRRPAVGAYFGLEVKHGISDYLLGKCEIEDIVYASDKHERLLIVPSGEPVQDASELISAPRMREFIAWTRDPSYGTITIFDTPPVLVCDDVLAFSPLTDAFLFVASDGMTNRTALRNSVELLSDQCDLLGIVLNRSRELSNSGDYYYYY